MKDLCEHLTRSGEPVYACILRYRSGVDSGNIGFRCRTPAIEKLSDCDKQDIVNSAYALYESICNATDMIGRHDPRNKKGDK